LSVYAPAFHTGYSVSALWSVQHLSLQVCVFGTARCFVESDARRFGAALPFKELSRQYTPCAWALVPDAPEVLMIEDLTKDARSLLRCS